MDASCPCMYVCMCVLYMCCVRRVRAERAANRNNFPAIVQAVSRGGRVELTIVRILHGRSSLSHLGSVSSPFPEGSPLGQCRACWLKHLRLLRGVRLSVHEAIVRMLPRAYAIETESSPCGQEASTVPTQALGAHPARTAQPEPNRFATSTTTLAAGSANPGPAAVVWMAAGNSGIAALAAETAAADPAASSASPVLASSPRVRAFKSSQKPKKLNTLNV